MAAHRILDTWWRICHPFPMEKLPSPVLEASLKIGNPMCNPCIEHQARLPLNGFWKRHKHQHREETKQHHNIDWSYLQSSKYPSYSFLNIFIHMWITLASPRKTPKTGPRWASAWLPWCSFCMSWSKLMLVGIGWNYVWKNFVLWDLTLNHTPSTSPQDIWIFFWHSKKWNTVKCWHCWCHPIYVGGSHAESVSP